MNFLFFKREHTRTKFIHFNPKSCKACWDCLDICPNKIISKIDLPWHKHALIIYPDKCTACLKCIKTCKFNAFSKLIEME